MSRFPESVPEGEKCEIPLDDLAKQMSTERRRIYDIVNVLEAVQMMTKVRFFTFFCFFYINECLPEGRKVVILSIGILPHVLGNR